MQVRPASLPETALVDTGVFGRFLDEMDDDRTIACKEFCRAMLAAKRTLFVAAPTIAEICRKNGRRVPHTAGIQVVPFDGIAADLLAERVTMDDLIEARGVFQGTGINYWKYDALIIGCALRARAEMIVTLDERFHRVGKDLIPVRTPDHFGSRLLPGIK